MNNKNLKTNIIVNVEGISGGLYISCGSSTSKLDFKSWEKTFPAKEKSKALNNMISMREEWKSKGAQVIIKHRGLTEEEVKVVEWGDNQV
ncbi:MAG: hypothetical protein FD145_1112 [Candidatus Saganbacteria bacterium]|uniref:Uncharacterized protein n=1 Tax=Candidatus Saganbacteria bacterium TaxID=2575572 RepID=A0A833NZR7_UNCSA|nr:MAG: hypothetical protein FD145_1112 [Candidatus Saganbacteria bacterium]